ncbi:MAG: hypothetical protein MUE72_12980, partial [Chitinophagaceae bacterium]|nr:hypothetical protein [Chitinophagaceae bacterium]
MSHQLFDKHIKEQLENFATPVPKSMWNKIVEEKKRRPTIFWWNSKPFLMFSLLVTISTFGVFMLYHQNKVEANYGKLNIPKSTHQLENKALANISIANHVVVATKQRSIAFKSTNELKNEL